MSDAPEAGRPAAGRPSATAPGGGPGGEEAAAAEVLARLRAGVRQRRAELATLPEEGEEHRLRLLELRASEYLQEPRPVSPRPLLGPLLVAARKAVFHLFLKWHLRPLVQQQNRFNQAAGDLLADLLEAQRHLRSELRRLAERLADLERPAGDGEPGTGGGASPDGGPAADHRR
jgi:hypothetical protein